MCFAANRDLPSAGFRTWSTRGIWANAQMFHEIGRSGVAKLALVIGVVQGVLQVLSLTVPVCTVS